MGTASTDRTHPNASPKTSTYTSMAAKTQNTYASRDTNPTQASQASQAAPMPLSKSTSVRSMMPLNRSDTLNFIRNDPDTLQYRPFVAAHVPSTDAKVPSTLAKSISFGGNANSSSASNMYDDDIDFMNNYLKSLPDYNELNKKISNEQKKCADIYDQLKSINTSLQSQSQSHRLPKSNSFHSICTGASSKPFAMQSISVGQSANDIDAKNKNATINRMAIPSTPSSSSIEGVAIGADKFGAKPSIGTSSSATLTSSTASTSKPVFDFVTRSHHPLPKSASSSCVNVNAMANDANGSKKCLNDFWSEHLARNNQQKFGWNYNKIMAVQKANKQPPIENGPAAVVSSAGNTNSYKLQKNMSLSHLDNRIRQDLSREELYNLICNSDQSTVNRAMAQPLSKSVSQTSVPSASFTAPVKISRKPSIPTLFKPLCKSTSNTHVFNRNYDTSDEPRETFTPKLLVKSCSSSSVFGGHAPASHTPTSNCFHPMQNSTQSRILRNNELLKGGATPAQPHQTKLFNGNVAIASTTTPAATKMTNESSTKQMAANDFFMKQNVPQPNKVIVNYPPFKSASSVQIPLHGNLPPAFGQPMPSPPPPTTSMVAAADNKYSKNGGSNGNGATTNFYNSNVVQMVQSKHAPMYSTPSSSSSVAATTAITSVGSNNNNLNHTTAKCKNEVNQQNELLKQPMMTATTTTTTPSNLFPNKLNFNEIDSNRNAMVRPYVSIGGDTNTFNVPSTLSSSSSSLPFRNGCATATVGHYPSNGERQMFAASKPDPLEKIPRRMAAVQPTVVIGAGMPAAKKLPHSFSSSCVSDLLRANASKPATTSTTTTTTTPNHGNIMRSLNAPSTQNQNNFTAQTLLYSRLYPNANYSSSNPLPASHAKKSNAIDGQQPQHPPRTSGQMVTPMPYKSAAPTQPYALTQSKSATVISRKDSSWLERHGYEIVDMSTSMHNAEVASPKIV